MMHYRMDAELKQGESIKWPVVDVLFGSSIESKDIGIYGWYNLSRNQQKDTVKIHIPLEVSTKIQNISNDKILRLYFRSIVDIDYMISLWSCEKGSKSTKSDKVYRAGKPIILFPPTELSGLCLIDITATIKKRDSGGSDNIIHKQLVVFL